MFNFLISWEKWNLWQLWTGSSTERLSYKVTTKLKLRIDWSTMFKLDSSFRSVTFLSKWQLSVLHPFQLQISLFVHGIVPVGGGGGYLQYTWRGLHIASPKNTWAWNFTPKKIHSIKICTSILIYSIKQTLRPEKKKKKKKYVTDHLTPKKYRGWKFSILPEIRQYVGPPRHVYFKYPPPPPSAGGIVLYHNVFCTICSIC